jgi:cyclic beta-1,2-glucan synthetase
MVKAIDQGRAITPAAEWLIDNYYLVERQIREIRTESATRLLSSVAKAG